MSSFASFRGRLLRAAGLTVITPFLCTYACGGEVVVVQDGTGGAASTTAGPTSASSTGSTDVASSSTATSTVSSTVAVTVGQTSSAGPGGGGDPTQLTCFPSEDMACPGTDEALVVFGDCTYEGFLWIEEWIDGPFVENGECCYQVVANAPCGIGRPLRTEDGTRCAAPVVGDAWSGGDLDAGDVDPELRAALRDAWLSDALLEHASVASFARFALELMACGAPPDLIADAHAAAGDEVRHAALCFALAARYGEAPVGPGPFDTRDLPARSSLDALAAATAAEGCVGETLAALLAAEQHRRATDPRVKEALAVIAEDEARHAELAWRTVAWALSEGGEEVRRAVAAVFADPRRWAPTVEAGPCGGEAHGRLGAAAAREVVVRGLQEVVVPSGKALLAAA